LPEGPIYGADEDLTQERDSHGSRPSVLDKYVAYMKDDPPSGFIGAAYGHVVEEPQQLLLVAGWESSEVSVRSCITPGQD